MQEYLNGLNEPQREAVTHLNGPLMIVAGAGSGKTKTASNISSEAVLSKGKGLNFSISQ